MRCSRFIPVLLGVAGLAVLGGALAAPSFISASVPPPSPAPQGAYAPHPAPHPAVADPAARTALARAIEALADDRVAWLETRIWQKVELPGLAYEASGSYRMAPQHRFRLELETDLGGARSSLLKVSDGTTLWQASRTGAGGWTSITRVRLEEVFATLNGPAGSPQLQAEFYQGPTFSGIAPLLRNLGFRLVWARQEAVRGNGAERLVLTGFWPPEAAAVLAPPEQPWPPALPYQCRLFLNARTYWPERVEWWGPPSTQGSQALLAEMEFRSPRLNRPLTSEQCARAFTFDPGKAPVTDETRAVTADLTARARDLAVRSSPH